MMARAMLKTIIWCARNAGGDNSNLSNMLVHFNQAGKRNALSAFTLMEVLIGFIIFGLVTSAMIYGYVQANRLAEWSSQSLAAMSYASQGMEQLRSAQWCAEEDGETTTDVLGNNTNIIQVDTLDIPTSGDPIYVTNYMSATRYTNSLGLTSPPMKLLVSRVVWSFRLTGQLFTNTIVSLRAPDQLQ
jgi:type II secretory pathway pseudopilin PulG